MIQTINNTPVNPDTIKVAFDKTNANFVELYSALTISKTSDLINDGSDGINQFITIQDVPTTIAISNVIGLSEIIDQIENDVLQIQTDIQNNNNDVVILNATILTLNGIINTQNGQIATMQSDIANLYNIVNNL